MDWNFSAFIMGIHAWLGEDSIVHMLGDVSTPNEDNNNPPHFDKRCRQGQSSSKNVLTESLSPVRVQMNVCT